MSSSGLTDYEQLRKQPSAFVSTICDVEPFDYQREFLDTDARHRVIASGRQVGKSRMCAWLGLHEALTTPYTQVLITAPSLRQSSLLFDTLYSEIDQSGLDTERWGIERDTQTIIEFDNGSSIHCLPTGRNGNKIRGFTADMIIVDEAAFVGSAIFEDILEPMTFATGGRMVLASTPWGKSGYFYDKFKRAEYTDTWSRTQVSSYDNPIIDDDDLEEFKEGKTKSQIQREVLGEFVDDAGQFFPSSGIEAGVRSGPPSRQGEHAFLGVDIAGSGEDRTVFYGVDELGNVFLNDEAYDTMGVLEAAKHIKHLDHTHGFDRIYVDRTAIGEGTVEALANDPQLDRKVEQVYFSVQKKQQIYQRLKAALEAEFLTLPQDTTLQRELESIGSNKTRAGNLQLYPRGETETSRDDHVDALALACWGLPDFGDQDHQPGASKTIKTAPAPAPAPTATRRRRKRPTRQRRAQPRTSSTNTRSNSTRTGKSRQTVRQKKNARIQR